MNVLVFSVCERPEARLVIATQWVDKVVRLGPITPIPAAPPSLCGVASCHGRVIPVVALGQSLWPAASPACASVGDGEVAILVALDDDNHHVALLATEVFGPRSIAATLLSSGAPTDVLAGIVEHQQQVYFLVDPSCLLKWFRREIESRTAPMAPGAQGGPMASR